MGVGRIPSSLKCMVTHNEVWLPRKWPFPFNFVLHIYQRLPLLPTPQHAYALDPFNLHALHWAPPDGAVAARLKRAGGPPQSPGGECGALVPG